MLCIPNSPLAPLAGEGSFEKSPCDFHAKLSDQCRRIGLAPLAYVSREDLAPCMRMAALGHYVIFFRVLDGAVRIERVLHGARNLPMLFGAAGNTSD